MHSLRWPGLRRASTALAASGCLILAACGGGSPAAKPSSPKPTASATAPAEPVSGPAAVAAITANWKTVFSGKAPIPRRLDLLQDGPQVAAFVEAQAKTSFGAAAAVELVATDAAPWPFWRDAALNIGVTVLTARAAVLLIRRHQAG